MTKLDFLCLTPFLIICKCTDHYYAYNYHFQKLQGNIRFYAINVSDRIALSFLHNAIRYP